MMYSPFRHIGSVFWKRKPIQLTFFLTRRCNAKCPFCFYLSRQAPADDNPGELTVPEIRKISDPLGRLLWLAFSGGEIFLRKDIVEITKIFYQRNKPAIILFPTNGILPDLITEQVGRILRSCPNSSIVVKLSLDGPQAVHDRIRGVAGAFNKTLETFDRLAGYLDQYPNFDLGINTVFCAENQDLMDETFDMVGKLKKVGTHTVSLIRGEVSDPDMKVVDLEKYLKTIKRLEKELKGRKTSIYGFNGARLKAAQDILQRRYIYQTAVHNRQLLPCYAGKLNLVLSETGDLYPCESFTRGMGNVRDHAYNIGRMLKSERAGQAVRDISESKCFCTHECYVMTNILFNPLKHPALLREYLQL